MEQSLEADTCVGEFRDELRRTEVVIYKGLKCELNPHGSPCRSQSSPDCSVSTERIVHNGGV
ncbi:hypothetical protein [Nostoc sp.]|uniref:hypothetical protein n=1 Tax=Nostoc sp. TaxID=1180 RepID=UPI002FF485BD